MGLFVRAATDGSDDGARAKDLDLTRDGGGASSEAFQRRNEIEIHCCWSV